jgi:hypothetical protein
VVETEEHEGRSKEIKQQFHPDVGTQPRRQKQRGGCFEMFPDITNGKSTSPSCWGIRIIIGGDKMGAGSASRLTVTGI